MLKKILRTALVAAGVIAIAPFAGAQGYVAYGGPMVMGRLGGGVVTPGVYSVFNPSAGYARAMQYMAPPMRPRQGSFGFLQPSGSGPIYMMGATGGTNAAATTAARPAVNAAARVSGPIMGSVAPPMLPRARASFGFLQPSGSGPIYMMGAPRGTGPAPTSAFRPTIGVRAR